ncbi:MAG: GNAT family N-acetyltransferase, partial [Sulfurovaceae bacterium]|nr:GNAT family N-acetyltransferase [Sulfurovaceae bacterium]
VASMPYYKKKKAIFTIITMPKHTQTMGVYIKYPEGQKYEKRLSYEKEVMSSLIEQLPKVDYFNQSFHYSVTNWLPFYWQGYTQTTNYTYVIEDLSNLESVFQNFNHAKRKNIKKAEKFLDVKFDLPAREFYDNHKMTLEKQNDKIAYSFEHFNRIYTSAYNHNAGRTIYAVDKDDNIHAALFVIWDKNSAYDLISTIDPSFRNSGSASLLIKEIIEFLSNETSRFDFEGSMIENVEKSFRQFGAKQKPYFNITKVNSKILKAIL